MLTAHPGRGWSFASWNGRCIGTGSTCRISLRLAAQVTASFAPVEPPLATATTTTPATVVTVVAGRPTEFAFTLSRNTVPAGVPVRFLAHNAWAIPHDFAVCSTPGNLSADSCVGTTTPLLGAATLTVTFTAPGEYEYLCTIPGHAAAGMRGLLTVT